MAARAAARSAAALPDDRAAHPDPFPNWGLGSDGLPGPATMTLGEALELLDGPGWACACHGGPPDGTSCCMRRYDRARLLVRAAGIVLQLLIPGGRPDYRVYMG